MPTDTDADLEQLLGCAPMRPVGRITTSSNQAVLVELGAGPEAFAIHKPIAFERPLWDYPRGTLALRERAAYLICRAAGLSLVPPTVMREGPWGPGSVQLWVGTPGQPQEAVVTVCDPRQVPEGWIEVLRGEDSAGHEVALAHSPAPDVRAAAVLDAVLNNSDRKGGHLAQTTSGLRGFDHGVSLGVEPKLRTVLWGWAGQPLTTGENEWLAVLAGRLSGELGNALQELLDDSEIAALSARIESLRRRLRHPEPSTDWPAIPWPAI